MEDVYFCETMFFVTECNAAKLHVEPDSNVIVQSAIFRKKKYSLLIKLSARAFYVVIKKYL